MFRILVGVVATSLLAGYASACDAKPERPPFLFRVGSMAVRPSGFLEAIYMHRGATTGDTVSTRYGQIPLKETRSEQLFSVGHSRMQICGQAGGLSLYVESDFLDAPGKSPYRFRQYWGEYRAGKWRVLAGKAWSLLRPNRNGITSEGHLLSTLVVDPAYHVGLAGLRVQQVRVIRDEGNWHYAISYESGKNFLFKAAHDAGKFHVEVAGLGTRHTRAISIAGVVHASRRIDFVSQQVISRGAGPALLNTIPAAVNAHSTIQGIESRVRPSLEVFAYGGIAYGGRSAGNRAVRQWTAGFIRHLFEPGSWGAASVAAQFSQVDRSTWGDGHGDMSYLQISFRYSLPASRSLFSDRLSR